MKTLLVLVALVVLLVLYASVFAPNLRREYDARLAGLSRPTSALPPIIEADLAALPPPVQRYLRRAGVIGKPPAQSVHVTFDATLFRAGSASGMSGPAHQIDVIDPPRRLFYMETRMFGLPVKVLHDYNGTVATMRVRIANLVDIISLEGPLLSRIESVTVLNDLTVYAPSALLGRAFSFEAIDDATARVIWTNGPYTVSAVLTIDPDGNLVNFRSGDRGDVTSNTSATMMPWETPLSDFRLIDGRQIPGRGEAVWITPDGPFTYGIFIAKDVVWDRL